MYLSTLTLMILVSLVSSEDDLRVQTKSGAIKGHYKTSSNGRKYRAFEGIPYAKPPVGDLRFEPPQAISAWENELSATKQTVCIQHSYKPTKPEVFGTEDCLYLNVYTPLLSKNSSLLPVIFFIYGGAFRTGSTTRFAPTYVMNRDIILVTLDFRVGPLGWLSTEDNVVPGNMALKDQSVALRWFSENAEAFGGNSSRITLAGHSSGGINAHQHYFSPWSHGLYQRGMSMSGTAFSPSAFVGGSLEKAKKLATLLNCTTANSEAMVSCLKSVEASDILDTMPEFSVFQGLPVITFGPVVEKGGEYPFLNATPFEILKNGGLNDVPWITGVVSEEGAHTVSSLAYNATILKELNENWEDLAPHLLLFNWTLTAVNRTKVASLIREHFFGSAPIDNSTVDLFIELVGTRIMIMGAEKSARLQAKANKSPVWFYYNSYRGAHSLTDTLTGTKINYGAAHGDDIFYIMENSLEDMTTTPQDRAMQNTLLDFWMSYAYNGTPNVGIDWPPLDPLKEELYYLHFWGPGNFTWDSVINFAQKEFWESINFHE